MSEEIRLHIISLIISNRAKAEITPESLIWAVGEFDAQRNRERLKGPEYKVLLDLAAERQSPSFSKNEFGGQNV